VPRRTAPAPAAPANLLLAALPGAEYERLRPHLEAVPLCTREVLQEPGRAIPHVHFPTCGVVSLLTLLRGGGTVEVGLVGREGVVGLPVFLGVASASVRYVVQAPGEALRMRAGLFRDLVERDSSLHGLLLRYTDAFLTQVSQAVACNTRHPVKQRLCRWLLMTHVRVGSDCFPLTQEFLAAMLGVRRASVSEVAGGLQQAGLIRCGRGEITILDRRGLEAAACECYQVVRGQLDPPAG
jgi:CRP-like cAMP-binding protein